MSIRTFFRPLVASHVLPDYPYRALTRFAHHLAPGYYFTSAHSQHVYQLNSTMTNQVGIEFGEVLVLHAPRAFPFCT